MESAGVRTHFLDAGRPRLLPVRTVVGPHGVSVEVRAARRRHAWIADVGIAAALLLLLVALPRTVPHASDDERAAPFFGVWRSATDDRALTIDPGHRARLGSAEGTWRLAQGIESRMDPQPHRLAVDLAGGGTRTFRHGHEGLWEETESGLVRWSRDVLAPR
jgi:hypothetical protein